MRFFFFFFFFFFFSAPKSLASLLEAVWLGEHLILVGGVRHLRLRKELLQVLVLVRKGIRIMRIRFRHRLSLVLD